MNDAQLAPQDLLAKRHRSIAHNVQKVVNAVTSRWVAFSDDERDVEVPMGIANMSDDRGSLALVHPFGHTLWQFRLMHKTG